MSKPLLARMKSTRSRLSSIRELRWEVTEFKLSTCEFRSLNAEDGVLKEAEKAPHPHCRHLRPENWCANAVRRHTCGRSLPIGRPAVDTLIGNRLLINSFAQIWQALVPTICCDETIHEKPQYDAGSVPTHRTFTA